MSIEKNVALVHRAVSEVWNRLDLDLADQLFDPAYTNHGGIIPDLVTGPESIKFAVVLQHTAFPCLEVREQGVTADENVVELRWAARRFPKSRGASRSPVLVARGWTLIRCAHDQIAESWTTWDCPVQGDVDTAWWPSSVSDRLAG